MTTPTYFFVPPPTAEEMVKRLEDVVQSQQEATPEHTFQDENEQSYQWMCEIEHHRFTPKEVDEHRMGVLEPDYWEQEARHLQDRLSKLIWGKLHCKYIVDGVSARDCWRNIAMAYTRRLMRQGLSTQQVRECRLAINDQRYWEPEAVRLREISARREYDMKEKHRERLANMQGIPVEGETQRRYPETKQRRCRRTPTKPTRRSPRSHPNDKEPLADRVSKRRSGLRSAGKRSAKVSAKPRQR
jgi:hypothetical protein